MQRNFYTILGLPDYANLNEVRRAFKTLAVRYHPDKNPGDKQAEERFKEISNAYNVLGESDTKYDYDIRLSGLKMMLKSNPEKEKEEKRKKMREELLRRRKEEEEADIRNSFKRLNSGVPLRLRFALNIALVATGIVIFFKHWFYTVDTFSPAILIIAMAFIAVGNVRIQRIQFIRLLYKNLLEQLAFNLHFRITRNFLIGFAGSVLLAIGMAQGMAWFHLKYYSETTEGWIEFREESKNNWQYHYVYEVNGKRYVRYISPEKLSTLNSNRIQVQYSTENPIYARILTD